MSGTKDTEGKYMYCIVRSLEPRQFTTLGIGERGDIVHTVHHKYLAAVVSDSPVDKYEQSRRNMMAHTLVLEEVMGAFTILPVRFGTIASSVEAIQEKVLERRYDELVGLLDEMEGQVELGLKAFWYEEAIFREIVQEDADIRRLRDSLMGHPVEETYYERIRLGEMVEKAMLRKRDEEAERLLASLRPLAHKTKRNPTGTGRMILNAVFLVDEDRQAAFDAEVDRIDQEMGKRFLFKYVGPVPPYNFVNIVVQWDSDGR
jgi:hypothetical protein